MSNTASDQIIRAIQEGKDSDVSKELILASLREHNIQDLDHFLDYGLQSLKKAQPRALSKLFPELTKSSHEDVTIELLFGTKAQSNAKSIVHTPPKLPFIVGNAHYKPSEIHRFNGQLLRFVWDKNAVSNGFIRAVTHCDEMRSFLASAPAPQSNNIVVYSHVPGAGHTFYEHINFGGAVLNLPYRHAFPDLTQVTMSGWWFWATSWNDQISSIITGSGPVTLAEDIMNPYLTGATMTFGAYSSIPWIGLAWNDRVSAILG